jgi:hypothetical protein
MTNSPISLQTSLIATPGLHERSVGGKVFLLDAESVMHALDNEVAVAIWTAIRDAPQGGVTVEAVARAIVEGYEVESSSASRDTLDFARLLHARGILAAAD